MTRDQFFDKKSKGALWDVGVSIKRGNPLPIDADSVFESLTDAQTYAAGVLAYPGQIIAVVAADATTLYYIDQAMALQEVGANLIGDGSTIEVNAETKQIRIKGFDTAENGSQLTKNADGKMVWVKPDTTTVAGLQTAVSGLQADMKTAKTDIAQLKKDAVIGLVKDETAASGMSATYHLTQDGKNVGTAINIPADMVVSSGTVETKTAKGEWGEPGTYIVLTIANKTKDKLYIPADSLIEYVTSGSATGDMVVISVSDDHKVTATITDGTVTKAKLATAVQTSLGKADSALQEANIVTGETDGTIKVGTKEVAVKGFKTSESIAQDIATAKQEAIDAAATTTNTSIKTATGDLGTNKTVKEYVDSATAGVASTAADNLTTTKEAIESDVAAKYVAKEGYVAYSDAEKTKLKDIAEGAQVNKIESIKDGSGTALTIGTDKSVQLPLATATKAGLVKPGAEFSVDASGTLSVAKVNLTKIEQTAGDTLILNCGTSARS